MGHTVRAKCLDCGEQFKVDHGGGFIFHLLRCDKCGENKYIGFDDIPDLHAQYLKGLPGPYSMASSSHDKWIQEHAEVNPISEEDYHNGVEKFAGACRCTGNYRFGAPPRCPRCSSKNIEEGEQELFYD